MPPALTKKDNFSLATQLYTMYYIYRIADLLMPTETNYTLKKYEQFT